MESNKDEAQRCCELAEEKLKAGDLAAARKFVKKSLNLFPTDHARVLDRKVTHLESSSSSASTASASTPAAASSSTPRTTTAAAAAPAGRSHSAPPEREHTKEQLAMVKRVLSLSNYYEVLEVTKEANDVDIKKSYRKLALQLHPDKNGAPGADEAFKRVNDAFNTLSDVSKRKQYDLYGRAPSRGSGGMNEDAHAAFNDLFGGGSGGDFTQDDLFNMFFNGQMPNNGRFRMYTTYTRNGRRTTSSGAGGAGGRGGARASTAGDHAGGGAGGQRAQTGLWQLLIQLLPLILLFVFFLIGSGNDRPMYSLQKMDPYIIAKRTSLYQLDFFLDVATDKKFQRDPHGLAKIDRAVEEDYLDRLRLACMQEERTQKQVMSRASWFGTSQELDQAKSMSKPNCDKLQQLQNIKRGLRSDRSSSASSAA